MFLPKWPDACNSFLGGAKCHTHRWPIANCKDVGREHRITVLHRCMLYLNIIRKQLTELKKRFREAFAKKAWGSREHHGRKPIVVTPDPLTLPALEGATG